VRLRSFYGVAQIFLNWDILAVERIPVVSSDSTEYYYSSTTSILRTKADEVPIAQLWDMSARK